MEDSRFLTQTEITVKLDTGSVIKAVCGVVEETYIIDSIVKALTEQGAKVEDYHVERTTNVTGTYVSRFRGSWV